MYCSGLCERLSTYVLATYISVVLLDQSDYIELPPFIHEPPPIGADGPQGYQPEHGSPTLAGVLPQNLKI